uniref:Uncharacterized protein n=1 Tax=Sciurus vulgaris TaxID=55149 RepID=A0A8D2DWI4_SCIVU
CLCGMLWAGPAVHTSGHFQQWGCCSSCPQMLNQLLGKSPSMSLRCLRGETLAHFSCDPSGHGLLCFVLAHSTV